jgi:peptidoglycan hydrolase CwlO-like protein
METVWSLVTVLIGVVIYTIYLFNVKSDLQQKLFNKEELLTINEEAVKVLRKDLQTANDKIESITNIYENIILVNNENIKTIMDRDKTIKQATEQITTLQESRTNSFKAFSELKEQYDILIKSTGSTVKKVTRKKKAETDDNKN